MGFDWTQIGIAGAVVAVVFAFLKEMKSARGEFLNTIRNHLDHNTNVIQALHNWLKGRIGND